MLFVPAHDERRVPKALASAADAVILDLEDAVPAAEKALARSRLAGAVGAHRRVLVRVNAVGTEDFGADWAAVRALDVAGAVLPKASSAEEVPEGGPPILAIVETATGLRAAHELAAHPGVAALALGGEDLALELGWSPLPDDAHLLYARSKLAVDCAAARAAPPVDVVHVDTRDLEGLERSARRARALGFAGKLCIHPDQVPVVNRVFAPSEEELAWAARVVDAFASGGRGAITLDGKMIDRPVVERARGLLAEAERSGA